MNKKLVLIILIGLIIRLILLNSHDIIEIDGSNYMKIAENLVSGNGYLDLSGKTNIIFPPLYPLISGMLGFLINNFELAGRLVSLLSGLGLILIMYLISKKLYDKERGLICAALVSLYPALTFISGITYTESLYLFLIALGIYLGWLSLKDNKRWSVYFILGIIFGLAYLTRSEGLLFFLVIIFLNLIFKNPWKIKIKNILFSVLGLIIICMPYWIFLYSQLGVFSLGVQSTSEFLEEAYTVTQSSNIKEYELNYLAMDFSSDNYKGLNQQNIFGYVLNNPVKFFERYFSNLYKEQTSVLPKLYPIIFILIAFAGLILGNWNTNRKKQELYLILCFLAPLLALPISYVSPRMILSSLLVLLIWTSNGVKELDKWIKDKFNVNNLVLIFVLLAFLFGNLIINKVNISDTPFTGENENDNLYKESGLWIKANYNNTIIMTREGRISYYAGAKNVKLAYGNIQYIIKESCKANVNFIALDRKNIEKLRPELVYLLEEKNTPNNLMFIKKFKNDILIYKPLC